MIYIFTEIISDSQYSNCVASIAEKVKNNPDQNMDFEKWMYKWNTPLFCNEQEEIIAQLKKIQPEYI